MKNNLLSILSIMLVITLSGCTAKDAVGPGDETTSEVVTEGASETDAVPTVEPTEEPTEETTEKPTEPIDPQGGRPDYVRVENKYDTFIRDVITVNNSEYEIPEEALQGLYGVMNYEHYKYYDVGFYVLDLGSGMSFGYNADEYFNPGCTRKAGFALAWFKQAETARLNAEKGYTSGLGRYGITVDHRYFYDGSDYLAGAGYVGRHGSRWYTIGELLYYMIHDSDNTAYNALWKIMGIDKYKSLCVKLGVPEHPYEYRRDKLWTPMRPLDLGLIWQEIWRYKDSGSPEATNMWYYFTHNNFNEIAKVVTGADVIAHKAGSDDYGFHEAGIVVRGDNAYVVVAMSTVPLPIANDNYDCIHMVIERIDPIMQEYYKWYEEEHKEESEEGSPVQ